MAMINRYKTQSISITLEELEAFKVLAARLRMKPAAAARAFFYRGLEDFLNDGSVHPQLTDDEVFQNLLEFLKINTRLTPVIEEADQQYLFSTGDRPAKSKRESRMIRKDIEDIKRDARARTDKKIKDKKQPPID